MDFGPVPYYSLEMLNISHTKWKLNLLFYSVRSGLSLWYTGHRFHYFSLTEIAVAVKKITQTKATFAKVTNTE